MIQVRNLTKQRKSFNNFKKLYKKIFPPAFQLSVVLVQPTLMRRINKKFRGVNKTTNVLSFLLEKDVGEIFININEENVNHLFIHGSLHLLGYEHKNTRETKAMQTKEKTLLKNI